MNFIGRKDQLDALHGMLADTTTVSVQSVALHGMGGIGKSRMAVEYIYRHAEEYDLICWIPAEILIEVQVSLVRLAERLALPVEQSIDTAVPAVLDMLSTDTRLRWLLVFDDADDPASVRAFWLRRGDVHMVVHSR